MASERSFSRVLIEARNLLDDQGSDDLRCLGMWGPTGTWVYTRDPLVKEMFDAYERLRQSVAMQANDLGCLVSRVDRVE